MLTALCALLFFYNLGSRDLTSSHEARAAQNAQMILDEGHWLLPRLFDRQLELQKPPLYYWLVALIGGLQGGTVDAWAVRLPAALSALSCVLFLFYLGARLGRPRAGYWAALILATCLHFTWLARVGRIDMPLTFLITLALGAFHLGRLGHRFRWHAAGYTALALGLLLKGPIALVLPALVCGVYWLCIDRFEFRRHLRHARATSLWWGLPWMLVIAAPWFVWANYQTGNQLWEVFFWHHNLERGLGSSETLASHPWWFYGPRALVDLLPWSGAVPLALFWFWRSAAARRDAVAWAGLLWFGVIATFLSLMRFKRADYLLPAYPGLAIFLGVCFEKVAGGWTFETTSALRRRAIAIVVTALLVAYVGGWMIYESYFAHAGDRTPRALAEEIRKRTAGPVIFFRAESHALHFHVAQPLDTILEWENLARWAARPIPVYVVMPEEAAREWRDHLPAGALEEVLHSREFLGDSRERPVVVLRNRGKSSANP